MQHGKIKISTTHFGILIHSLLEIKNTSCRYTTVQSPIWFSSSIYTNIKKNEHPSNRNLYNINRFNIDIQKLTNVETNEKYINFNENKCSNWKQYNYKPLNKKFFSQLNFKPNCNNK